MLERLLACEHKPEACAAHSFVMGPAVVNNNKASLEGLRGVEGLRGGLPSKGRRRKVYSKQHNIYIAMKEEHKRARVRELAALLVDVLFAHLQARKSAVALSFPSNGWFVTGSGLDMDLTKV